MRNGRKVVARIFSTYTGPGNYYLHDRMRMLDKKRFETICIYLKKTSNEHNPLEDDGFSCFYISSNRKLSKLNLSVIYKLARVLREQKVDILHCNRHQATQYSIFASLITKVSVILSHVHGQNRAKRLTRKLFYKVFGRRISKYLAVSNAVAADIAQNFSPCDDSHIVVLNNSIDHNFFANIAANRNKLRQVLNIPNDAFVFITVGRLVPTKGYSYLIDAFATVKKKLPGAHLLIVGEGRERQDIEERIGKAGLTSDVTLAGYRKDVAQLLKASDVFVLSSLKEGWPLVILEAMAAGIPVVATASGGQQEVIRYGENGYLVPVADGERLGRAMIDSMELTDDQRQTIIGNAKQLAYNNFSHKAAVRHLEEIYELEFAKQP
ncbi:MAG: glycosyltransferase [Anaerohalosphaera sp.]|nr:glycosyltransferase [Anaerohalosphaera sp.]